MSLGGCCWVAVEMAPQGCRLCPYRCCCSCVCPQFFRGVGVVTCLMAIGAAVQTLMKALDLETVPCPTSTKPVGSACDVCAFKANANEWFASQNIPIEYWGCRSRDETLRAIIHSVFLIIGASPPW